MDVRGDVRVSCWDCGDASRGMDKGGKQKKLHNLRDMTVAKNPMNWLGLMDWGSCGH